MGKYSSCNVYFYLFYFFATIFLEHNIVAMAILEKFITTQHQLLMIFCHAKLWSTLVFFFSHGIFSMIWIGFVLTWSVFFVCATFMDTHAWCFWSSPWQNWSWTHMHCVFQNFHGNVWCWTHMENRHVIFRTYILPWQFWFFVMAHFPCFH